MYKGSRPKLFPIVVIIIVIAIVVFGVVSLIRMFVGGGSSQQAATPEASTSSKLLDTSSSQSVVMYVRGPIVADEKFRSFAVTISPTGRSITAWQGYARSNVVATESYSNDTAAYKEFVNALNYAGYAKTRDVKNNDTEGLCANGKVYNFQIMNGGNVSDNRWTTNCDVKGTFAGNGPAVRNLFLEQIPAAQQVTSKIDL